MAQILVPLVATAAAVLAGAAAQSPDAKEADYVVVGGGTAGCALAARLCEGLPDAQVVLLERSSPRTEEQEDQVRAIRLMLSNFADPEVVEAWPSEPNEGLNGRSDVLLAGNTLGGSSAINGAQFSRPEAKVPASWGLTGLDEATAERLYARVKAQTQAGPQPEDLKMTYLEELLEAEAETGSPLVEDPKGEPVDGVWECNVMVDDAGRRQDSAYAYLRPVMAPSGVCAHNLELLQEATVSKILLEGTDAVGVEYLHGDDTAVVMAAKEVILSAGAFASPKILMLSGIGPAEDLAEFGIPVLADLPVGQHAHARSVMASIFTYSGMPVPPEAMTSVVADPETEAQFKAGEGGPWGVNPGMMNGIFGPPIGAWRAASLMGYPALGIADNTGSPSCFLNTDKRSRATVKLNSTDVTAPPSVDTNLLAQDEEVQRMAMCIEREQGVQQPLIDLGFNITNSEPGFDVPLDVAVREQASNGWHFVGSCGIGRVLDQDLKVFGFDNLRVVDASAIPDMVENSGPAGTTYMLAEHAAEQLIAEAGGKVDTEEELAASGMEGTYGGYGTF